MEEPSVKPPKPSPMWSFLRVFVPDVTWHRKNKRGNWKGVHFWGGPLLEPETVDGKWDNLRDSFFPNTTMHGTPRVYEANNGFLRTLFWLAVISVCGWATWLFTHETIGEYSSWPTVQTTYIDQSQQYKQHDLPNVTICSKQPVSCKCPLWYDDLVLDNLEYTYPILSLVCPEALDQAYFPAYPRKVTDSGQIFIYKDHEGVTTQLLTELGLPNDTSYSYNGFGFDYEEVDHDFWLDPDLGLGAKRYCPESFFGNTGECRFGGNCNCGTEAKKQADLCTDRM